MVDARDRSWQASRSSRIAALARLGQRLRRRRAQSCGTVIINEHSWAGSTANTYVAKYVLEKRLGCKVKVTNITEGTPYFQAMGDGKIDVVLEDWDNTTVASAKPYIKDKSCASSARTASPA